MTISLKIELKEEEKNLLKEIFSCSEAEIMNKIESFCLAAAEEYLRMFLGQKIFTRGSDMKEYRLYLLIRHLFHGSIPDEQTITTLFQTTSSESKSLLKSVLAKYQYELKSSISNTIKDILARQVHYDEQLDLHLVSNISVNIVEEMNKILSGINGALSQISRKRGALQTFEIKPSSYNELMNHFKLDVEENTDE